VGRRDPAGGLGERLQVAQLGFQRNGKFLRSPLWCRTMPTIFCSRMPGSAGLACHFSRETIGGDIAVETVDGAVLASMAWGSAADAGTATRAARHPDRANRLRLDPCIASAAGFAQAAKQPTRQSVWRTIALNSLTFV